MLPLVSRFLISPGRVCIHAFICDAHTKLPPTVPVIVSNFAMFYSHTQARAKLPKKRRRIMPVEHLPRSLAVRSNPNQLHQMHAAAAAAAARAPAQLAPGSLSSPMTGSNFAYYAPGLTSLSTAPMMASRQRENVFNLGPLGPITGLGSAGSGPQLVPRGATLDLHHTRTRINLSNKDLLPDSGPTLASSSPTAPPPLGSSGPVSAGGSTPVSQQQQPGSRSLSSSQAAGTISPSGQAIAGRPLAPGSSGAATFRQDQPLLDAATSAAGAQRQPQPPPQKQDEGGKNGQMESVKDFTADLKRNTDGPDTDLKDTSAISDRISQGADKGSHGVNSLSYNGASVGGKPRADVASGPFVFVAEGPRLQSRPAPASGSTFRDAEVASALATTKASSAKQAPITDKDEQPLASGHDRASSSGSASQQQKQPKEPCRCIACNDCGSPSGSQPVGHQKANTATERHQHQCRHSRAHHGRQQHDRGARKHLYTCTRPGCQTSESRRLQCEEANCSGQAAAGRRHGFSEANEEQWLCSGVQMQEAAAHSGRGASSCDLRRPSQPSQAANASHLHGTGIVNHGNAAELASFEANSDDDLVKRRRGRRRFKSTGTAELGSCRATESRGGYESNETTNDSDAATQLDSDVAELSSASDDRNTDEGPPDDLPSRREAGFVGGQTGANRRRRRRHRSGSNYDNENNSNSNGNSSSNNDSDKEQQQKDKSRDCSICSVSFDRKDSLDKSTVL